VIDEIGVVVATLGEEWPAAGAAGRHALVGPAAAAAVLARAVRPGAGCSRDG
jgi:hypothetical protein